MKKLLLLTFIGLVSGIGTSYAQDYGWQKNELEKFSQSVQVLSNNEARIKAFGSLINSGTQRNGKTDEIAQRLTGLRTNRVTSGIWELQDSASYTYSGTRGGTDPANTQYDVKQEYNLDGNTDTIQIFNRKTITFDANERPIEIMTEIWSGGMFENFQKYTYTYDVNGNQIIFLIQIWNGNGWENHSREVDTFNIYNNPLVKISQNWVNNNWINHQRLRNSYTLGGGIDTTTYEEWENGSWDVSRRIVNTYGSNYQKVIQLSEEESIGGVLEVRSRILFTYHINGYQIGRLTQKWQNSSWIDDIRWSYALNTVLRETFSLYEEFNTGVWRPLSRIYTTYNPNSGYGVSFYQENWNGNTWENYYQETYTYGSGVKPESYISLVGTGSAWTNEHRIDFQYNQYGNLEYQLNEIWNGVNWKDSVEQFRYYDEYEAPSGISSISTLVLNVYPNPVASVLNLDYNAAEYGATTICVYNAEGKLMLRTETSSIAGNNHYEINTQSLNSSIYFVELKQGNSIGRTKIVKQ